MKTSSGIKPKTNTCFHIRSSIQSTVGIGRQFKFGRLMKSTIKYLKSIRSFGKLHSKILSAFCLILRHTPIIKQFAAPNDVEIRMRTGGGIEQGDRTVTIEINNRGSKDLYVKDINIVTPEQGAYLCAYGQHRLGHRAPDMNSATLVIDTQAWTVGPGRTECKIIEVRTAGNFSIAEVEIILEYRYSDSSTSMRILHKMGPYGDS